MRIHSTENEWFRSLEFYAQKRRDASYSKCIFIWKFVHWTPMQGHSLYEPNGWEIRYDYSMLSYIMAYHSQRRPAILIDNQLTIFDSSIYSVKYTTVLCLHQDKKVSLNFSLGRSKINPKQDNERRDSRKRFISRLQLELHITHKRIGFITRVKWGNHKKNALK